MSALNDTDPTITGTTVGTAAGGQTTPAPGSGPHHPREGDRDNPRDDVAALAPYPPGYVLAPGYEVVEHVGRGEDLDSYEAWDTRRYCRCFVKTPRPELAADPVTRGYLTQEAHILTSLAHPHIVRAYDYLHPTATDPDQPPVLVLENLTGATLGYLLRDQQRLPSTDIGHLGQHLCSALRYLHDQGYLHLDVKPSNIIAAHGLARLIDFGLAQPPGPAPAGIGTPGYMSPEQFTGGHLSTATDTWAVGLVLYQAVTGHNPFQPPHHPTSEHHRPHNHDHHGHQSDTGSEEISDSVIRAAYQQRLDTPAPTIRARRRIPAPLAQVIHACLDRDPTTRPTLTVLADALTPLTTGT